MSVEEKDKIADLLNSVHKLRFSHTARSLKDSAGAARVAKDQSLVSRVAEHFANAGCTVTYPLNEHPPIPVLIYSESRGKLIQDALDEAGMIAQAEEISALLTLVSPFAGNSKQTELMAEVLYIAGLRPPLSQPQPLAGVA